jgi:2'-5' RNA ligase
MEHRTTQTVRRFANHWHWRPEWRDDRTCLLWYLTFADQPEVLKHAERLTSQLRVDGKVDVVPTEWLHLTVDDVAYADEMSRVQVEALVQATREAVWDCPLPALDLGPVSAMSSAVVLQARPRSALLRLRNRVQAVSAAVLRRDKPPLARDFLPHVSLGYVNDQCSQHQMIGSLDSAEPGGVRASVSRLTLAAVTRRSRHYQWTTKAVLRLPSA